MLNKMSVLQSINVFSSTMATIYIAVIWNALLILVFVVQMSINIYFFFIELFGVLMHIKLWKIQDFCSKLPDFKDSYSQIVFSYTAFTFLHN